MAKTGMEVAIDVEAVVVALEARRLITLIDVARIKEKAGNDPNVTLNLQVERDQLLYECGTAALERELNRREDYHAPIVIDPHQVAEAIDYIRDGYLAMATALFGRIFDAADMPAIEQALRA